MQTPQTNRQQFIDARRAELLTVGEFSEVLRITPLSVYRRIREGRQAGVYRFGREIRIDITEAREPV